MVHSAGEDLSKRVMLKLLDVFTDKKVGNTVKLLGGTWKIEDIQMCCLKSSTTQQQPNRNPTTTQMFCLNRENNPNIFWLLLEFSDRLRYIKPCA